MYCMSNCLEHTDEIKKINRFTKLAQLAFENNLKFLPSATVGARDRTRGLSVCLAVVNIALNTVRLFVYEIPTRLPIPIFNEKAECGLVVGLDKTGHLNLNGASEVMPWHRRFNLAAKAINVMWRKLDFS